MTTSFSLQNALSQVRNFNGTNGPLEDFIADVRTAREQLPEGCEQQYVRALVGKLRGAAHDSIYGKNITSVEQLITHLKNRFAPGRTHSYYTEKINSLRMLQSEKVGDFYEKINILLDWARNSLREIDAEHVNYMMFPLESRVVDIFIKGLPIDIAKAVDAAKPADLDTAYREAVRMEMRMDANILPDTRYKVVQKDSHAWKREEYASAGQHRQWRDNRSLHRNYLNYDRSRNNDRQGHYVGQIQPLMQNTPKLPVPVPTAQGAQNREEFQPSGRGYQDPGQLFQRDSRLFNPYDSRDDLAPATGGNTVNYTIQQRTPP